MVLLAANGATQVLVIVGSVLAIVFGLVLFAIFAATFGCGSSR